MELESYSVLFYLTMQPQRLNKARQESLFNCALLHTYTYADDHAMVIMLLLSYKSVIVASFVSLFTSVHMIWVALIFDGCNLQNLMMDYDKQTELLDKERDKFEGAERQITDLTKHLQTTIQQVFLYSQFSLRTTRNEISSFLLLVCISCDTVYF